MTSQRHPVQPETDVSPPPVIDAFYIITVLAAAHWLPELIINGLL